MSFALTEEAKRFIRLMLRVDGAPGAGFRLSVSEGGCSGLSADMEVRAEPIAGDTVLEQDGIKFFMPRASILLLDEVVIGFSDTAAKTGLVFQEKRPRVCGATAPVSLGASA